MGKRERIAAATALTVAALLIGAGIAAGEPASVMAKAIRICMECVGIG